MTLPTLTRLRLPALIMIVLTALMTASCHSGRNTAATGNAYEASGAKVLSQSELKAKFAGLESAYGTWDDLKIPVTLRLTSPKKFTIGGTMTMQRDRSIHLSLRFLGMEMASLMVTQDSIFALYKLEKLYVAESISDLLGGFPATVGNLQNLLLGRPFILGDSGLSASRCSLEGSASSWTLTPSGAPKGVDYTFTIDTATDTPQSLTVRVGSRKPATAEYSDFTPSPSGLLATTATLTVNEAKTALSADIDFNGRRAEWNSGTSRTWTTPKGYRRVTAADIMRIISTHL